MYKDAESTYLELLEARCIPTEDTYALLLKAYCKSGSLVKAEAIFGEMRKYGLPPSMIFSPTYIFVLMVPIAKQTVRILRIQEKSLFFLFILRLCLGT